MSGKKLGQRKRKIQRRIINKSYSEEIEGTPYSACARVNQNFFKEWCQSSGYAAHANAFLHSGSSL
jgi:hypothetical protein